MVLLAYDNVLVSFRAVTNVMELPNIHRDFQSACFVLLTSSNISHSRSRDDNDQLLQWAKMRILQRGSAARAITRQSAENTKAAPFAARSRRGVCFEALTQFHLDDTEHVH